MEIRNVTHLYPCRSQMPDECFIEPDGSRKYFHGARIVAYCGAGMGDFLPESERVILHELQTWISRSNVGLTFSLPGVGSCRVETEMVNYCSTVWILGVVDTPAFPHPALAAWTDILPVEPLSRYALKLSNEGYQRNELHALLHLSPSPHVAKVYRYYHNGALLMPVYDPWVGRLSERDAAVLEAVEKKLHDETGLRNSDGRQLLSDAGRPVLTDFALMARDKER